MAREIVWNKTAVKSLTKALKWISKDSYIQAEKIESDILYKIDTLVNRPEIFPTDKFKLNNDGTYRAFEIHSYRIAYRFTDTQIRILRIRHVKQEPKAF